MVRLVPVLEFLHEVRSAGLVDSYADVLEHPQEHWARLPDERRARFLERLKVSAPDRAAVKLSLLKRRGRAASADHVFLRVEGGGRPGLRDVLVRNAARVLFEPFEPLRPEGGALANVVRPAPVFTDASARSRSLNTLAVLDEAWGGEPYDAGKEGALTLLPPLGDVEEIDRYWVDEPFALVAVLRDREHELVYHVQEPDLTSLERVLLASLNDRLRDVLIVDPATERSRHAELVDRVFELLRTFNLNADRRAAYRLAYYCVRNYLGLGRLEPIMRDTAIEDVSCNGPSLPVYVAHSRHQNLRTNLLFDEVELNGFTIKLAQRGNKLLSVAQPLVDATLPDGSRIQACLGREITSRGSAFTIRKFREDPLTCVDLIRVGTHSLDTMAFLWLAVELRCSLLVMGATASGKTTTLNCLSQFIPPAMKIVTIEDTREITLNHENWLAAVTRESFTGPSEEKITMYDLLRAALRQRPEYLIVGEIRGVEGLTLFQAMSTGHTCFSTMHAGSVENAVHRLENEPINVPRVMLTALDFLLLQGQVNLKGRPVRRMLSLTEVNDMDASSRNLRMNEVFGWSSEEDTHTPASGSFVIEQARARVGWSRARVEEEVAARRRVLEALVEKNDRHYRSVAKAVRKFYGDRPEGASRAKETKKPDAVPARAAPGA